MTSKKTIRLFFEADVNIPNNEIWIIRLLGRVPFCITVYCYLLSSNFLSVYYTIIIYFHELFILILVCLVFIYLFTYANDYFLCICNFFYLFCHLQLHIIYIYLII